MEIHLPRYIKFTTVQGIRKPTKINEQNIFALDLAKMQK